MLQDLFGMLAEQRLAARGARARDNDTLRCMVCFMTSTNGNTR
jgi:hypothetical protein